jgi:hypothetical protein
MTEEQRNAAMSKAINLAFSIVALVIAIVQALMMGWPQYLLGFGHL